MKFTTAIILLWSLLGMKMEIESTSRMTHSAQDRVLRGPNGIIARFMGGIPVSYAGEDDILYAQVEIVRPGKKPVVIRLDRGARIDGDDATSRNVAKKSVDGASSRLWSLDLWSCDGRYIVLTSVLKLDNGAWDFRNSLLSAYDTTTGRYAEFKGATSSLATDTFVQWSPTDHEVAILRGSSNKEQARPSR